MIHNAHVSAFYSHKMHELNDSLKVFRNPAGNIAAPVRAMVHYYGMMVCREVIREHCPESVALQSSPKMPR